MSTAVTPMPTSRVTVATRNLVLGTAAFAVSFSAWGLIAPLAKKFQDTLDLSNTRTLMLTAVPVVLGSLLRIPFGVITDRKGGRRVFTAVLLASAVPVLAFGFVDSYWGLIVVGFFLGIAGASFAVGVPFVAGWYPKERQGFALGVYGMGNIGTAVAAFTAPAVVNHWGRPTLGVAAALVMVLAAVVFYSMADNPPRAAAPPRYVEVLRSGWRLYRLALLYFLTFGGFVAMAIFLPKLLKDWFGYSLTQAGLRAAGFTLVATAARPVGGWLSDKVGAPVVLTVALIGVAVDATALAFMAHDPTIVPVTIACLTLAGFLGLGNGAVFKLVPREFPDATGAATGIVGAAGGLGGFFPPIVMGIVKDNFDTYTLGFVGLLAFCLVCAAVAASMWRQERLRTA
jgi:NNP family nitrate/nitrite transporter-like MFS transporter